MSVVGGLGTLQFFGHLKTALELLISVRIGPIVTFQEHWVGTITLGEKKQTQKHASVICLETYIVEFSDALTLMVWFLLRFYDF